MCLALKALAARFDRARRIGSDVCTKTLALDLADMSPSIRLVQRLGDAVPGQPGSLANDTRANRPGRSQ